MELRELEKIINDSIATIKELQTKHQIEKEYYRGFNDGLEFAVNWLKKEGMKQNGKKEKE